MFPNHTSSIITLLSSDERNLTVLKQLEDKDKITKNQERYPPTELMGETKPGQVLWEV